MRRMQWLVGLGLLGVALLFLTANLAARPILQVALSRALGKGAKVGRVQISPLLGSTTIDDLVLPNPSGFGPGSALTIDRLEFDAAPNAALKNPIRITSLRLSGVHAVLEVEGLTTNLGTVFGQLEDAMRNPGGARRFAIDLLQINQAEALVDPPGAPAVAVALPDLTLRGLGGVEGLAAEPLLATVVKQIITEILADENGDLPGTVEEALSRAGSAAARSGSRSLRGTVETLENTTRRLTDDVRL